MPTSKFFRFRLRETLSTVVLNLVGRRYGRTSAVPRTNFVGTGTWVPTKFSTGGKASSTVYEL